MQERQYSNHPNPIFERANWTSLNGSWDFYIDENNSCEDKLSIPFDKKIIVPFCYQSQASGLNIDGIYENMWYKRVFNIDNLNQNVLLKVGGIDNESKIYINKQYVMTNQGAYISYEVDITKYLVVGENEIIIKASDSLSTELIRGKQSWEKDNVLCWYKNSSGIWQNIWLEFYKESRIKHVFSTPDLDNNKVDVKINIENYAQADEIEIELKLKDRLLYKASQSVVKKDILFTYNFEEKGATAVLDLFWSHIFPNLIDMKITLKKSGELLDEIKSYFGIRKVGTNKNRIYLNDEPLYQKLVLHQGYYPSSMLTPKSLEEMEKDILLIKDMGFNGVRLHQKIEDPRFCYLADKLGLLVWGELPSCYDFTLNSQTSIINTMREFIKRDYNHPCIINWVPFNESWGVHRLTANASQQNFVRSIYYMIKSMDTTRFVVSNDGWEQLAENDICCVHDYTLTPEGAKAKLLDIDFLLKTNAQFKAVYAEGQEYNNKPIIISEYGGIKYKGEDGWGYEGDAKDEANYINRLDSITEAIRQNKLISGYCYTQFTDVYHEKNGLVDINRNPKLEIEKIKNIFGKN